MDVAIEFHRSDNVSAWPEVHRPSSQLYARSDRSRDCLRIKGCAITLRSKGANITHWKRLGDDWAAKKQKEEQQKEFSQWNVLARFNRLLHLAPFTQPTLLPSEPMIPITNKLCRISAL